jgi:UDP-N-acetylglucosamine 2-epimerase (non-hydrolysing)
MNRRLTSALADLHFAPTHLARENLIANGVPEGHIHLTGNTITDALYHILDRGRVLLPHPLEKMKSAGRRLLLVETHRRENLGDPMRRICEGLKRIAESFEDVFIAFSLHKNPRVREVVCPELQEHPQVALLEPVDYPVLLNIMRDCHMVLTDSGGMQEEAPSLGKPVLVLRTTTERPEGIDTGNALLVGTDSDRIFDEASRLLTDGRRYDQMCRAVNPYGDGMAAERIKRAMLHHFHGEPAPEPFVPKPVEKVFS